MHTEFGHAWVPCARLGSSSSLVSNLIILHLSSFRLSMHPSFASHSHPLGFSTHPSLSTIELPLFCSEVSRIYLAMAHILTVVLSTSLALINAVYAPICFAETKYIEVATDKIQDLESSFSEILGFNLLSVHIAELALNYGKRYNSVRQWCIVSIPSWRMWVNQIKKLHKLSLRYGKEWWFLLLNQRFTRNSSPVQI